MASRVRFSRLQVDDASIAFGNCGEIAGRNLYAGQRFPGWDYRV
jgi:hypothetical protein